MRHIIRTTSIWSILVDSPIQEFTDNGIRTASEYYDLDVIIFATGFDAVTGSLDRIDIRGKGGVSLKEAWAEGPTTFLGLQARGFPNFFTLVGPHNGSAFCNVGVCGALQAEWVTRMISFMKERGLCYSEPAQQAEDEWTQAIYRDFSRTLMADANAWWVKVTNKPDGSVVRRALVYVGGGPEYRRRCEEVALIMIMRASSSPEANSARYQERPSPPRRRRWPFCRSVRQLDARRHLARDQINQ